MGVQSGRHSAQSYTPNYSIACNGAPINLNGEDIRSEKVKVLRSICRLEPCNVILGHYKDTSGDKVDVKLNSRTPTYFAAALYIGNAHIFVVCTLPDYDRNLEHTLKKMACETGPKDLSSHIICITVSGEEGDGVHGQLSSTSADRFSLADPPKSRKRHNYFP
ncbi:hypothetical protein WN944_003245 [Citrus x changshan-huyou]|uniref:Glucose-6-phosphate dehydrogenase C-terminal domain-containing protein n=1 Tax=Citrus x changshan-huyou TaxID=2935761 RepID=A0AAP0QFA3_9ROSI